MIDNPDCPGQKWPGLLFAPIACAASAFPPPSGLPQRIPPHVLRHTAITGLVKAGIDLPAIQKISGHKTLAKVLRYTQLTDDHIGESVAKPDSAFADEITLELHTAPYQAKRGAA